MPKNIPSLKPRELIRILGKEVALITAKGKETIGYLFVITKTKKELSPSTWARRIYRLLMFSEFSDNLDLLTPRLKTFYSKTHGGDHLGC